MPAPQLVIAIACYATAAVLARRGSRGRRLRRLRSSFLLVGLLHLADACMALALSALDSAYAAHGPGAQGAVSIMVAASLTMPFIIWPFFQAKDFTMSLTMPMWLEKEVVVGLGRWALTPPPSSSPSPRILQQAPPTPDYANTSFWAALGREQDSATLHPPDSLQRAPNPSAADTFYLPPTTYYSSASWNSGALNPVTSYLSDDAIIPQQATAFNANTRVFVPRIRQATAAVYLQYPDGVLSDESRRALDIAYADVAAAFEHYVATHNLNSPTTTRRRGIVLAGHSQGALHLNRLLHDYFCEDPIRCPLRPLLVTAYLIGWPVFATDIAGLPVCSRPDQTGCVVSWRTYEYERGKPVDDNSESCMLYQPGPARRRGHYQGRRGGPSGVSAASSTTTTIATTTTDGGDRRERPGDPLPPPRRQSTKGGAVIETPICVNPLTWTAGDGAWANGTTLNRGSLDLMHPWTMWNYLFGRAGEPQPVANIAAIDSGGLGQTQPQQLSLSKARVVVPRLLLPTAEQPGFGAQCLGGKLYTEAPDATGYGWSFFPAWRFASFPGRSLHSYDYNLYFENLRRNAAARVEQWTQLQNDDRRDARSPGGGG